jgi:type II secretory pathway pseudopilin PulG
MNCRQRLLLLPAASKALQVLQLVLQQCRQQLLQQQQQQQQEQHLQVRGLGGRTGTPTSRQGVFLSNLDCLGSNSSRKRMEEAASSSRSGGSSSRSNSSKSNSSLKPV